MDIRINTLQEGRRAARQLRQRLYNGEAISREEGELLLGKIDVGFHMALDLEQERCWPTPPPPRPPADFPETIARMAASGLKVTTGSMLTEPRRRSLLDWARPKPKPAEVYLPPDGEAPSRMRTVGHLGVIEGDRS